MQIPFIYAAIILVETWNWYCFNVILDSAEYVMKSAQRKFGICLISIFTLVHIATHMQNTIVLILLTILA